MRISTAINIFTLFLSAAFATGQDLSTFNAKPDNSEYSKSTILSAVNGEVNADSNLEFQKRISFLMDNQFRKLFRKEKQEFRFDLVSSVGSNISFGGIYEKYAFVNFTPNMYISPVDDIQIYANHNLVKVVPLEELNNAAGSLILQSIVLVAAENTINILVNERTWVSDLVTFTLKNILIGMLVRPAVKTGNRKMIPWIQDESFYYSVGVRF
jgi:hypothetical protein